MGNKRLEAGNLLEEESRGRNDCYCCRKECLVLGKSKMDQAILMLRGLHKLVSVMETTAALRKQCEAKEHAQPAR